MKKILPFLFSALLAAAALPAASFEGTVGMKITTPEGRTQEMTFSLRDGLTRIDMTAESGHSAAIIMDRAKNEMIMLMPQQHMFMIRPLPAPSAAPAPAAARTGTAQFEKTGVTEKILGYDATKLIVRDGDSSTEIWVTDQLGAFMGMGPGAGGPMARGSPGAGAQPWEKFLRGKDFFPLRVVSTKNGGTTRMEATSVVKQSLPNSLFAPPEGWQDIGAMMRGMMPPGAGGMPMGN